jgi:hypothetical protein
MKVAELRKLLSARGANTKGTKAILVDRLTSLDATPITDQVSCAIGESRGPCLVCSKPVLVSHQRIKCDQGYMHDGCADPAEVAAAKQVEASAGESNDVVTGEQQPAYGDMKVAELRKLLSTRGEDTKGTKAVLIGRLMSLDNLCVTDGVSGVEMASSASEKQPEYGDMKVAELRKLLSARGEDTKGTKAVLIQRLDSLAADQSDVQCKVASQAGPVEAEQPAYGKMKVVELRKLLSARGVDTKGTKAVLIERLTSLH